MEGALWRPAVGGSALLRKVLALASRLLLLLQLPMDITNSDSFGCSIVNRYLWD